MSLPCRTHLIDQKQKLIIGDRIKCNVHLVWVQYLSGAMRHVCSVCVCVCVHVVCNKLYYYMTNGISGLPLYSSPVFLNNCCPKILHEVPADFIASINIHSFIKSTPQ